MLTLLALACLSEPLEEEAPPPIRHVRTAGGGTAATTRPTSSGGWSPASLPQAAEPCREPIQALVTWEVDGDTAYVERVEDGVEEKVRFIGINAPEMGFGGEPAECWAEEATAEAARRLEGNVVWLTFDEECVDSYDRTLAYLHLGEQGGEFFNRDLVRAGFARAYPVYPNTTYERDFAQDENDAQSGPSGLWAHCD